MPPKLSSKEVRKLQLCLVRAAEKDDGPALQAILDQEPAAKGLLDELLTDEDHEGFALLHCCAMAGACRTTEILLDAGAAIDVRNVPHSETPLIISAIYAAQVGEILLRRGARADICDWSGKTALSRLEDPKGFSFGRNDPEAKQRLIKLLKESLAVVNKEGSAQKAEAEKLREEGNELFKKGRFADARKKYMESISFLEDYRTFSNLAACCLRMGIDIEKRKGKVTSGDQESYLLYMEAVNHAGKAARLKPDFPKGHYRLARAQMGKGDLPRAKWSLKDGLKHCPGNQDLEDLLRELESLGVKDSISGPYAGVTEKAQAKLNAGAPKGSCAWCLGPLPLPLGQFGRLCPYCAMDPADANVDRTKLNELRWRA